MGKKEKSEDTSHKSEGERLTSDFSDLAPPRGRQIVKIGKATEGHREHRDLVKRGCH